MVRQPGVCFLGVHFSLRYGMNNEFSGIWYLVSEQSLYFEVDTFWKDVVFLQDIGEKLRWQGRFIGRAP